MGKYFRQSCMLIPFFNSQNLCMIIYIQGNSQAYVFGREIDMPYHNKSMTYLNGALAYLHGGSTSNIHPCLKVNCLVTFSKKIISHRLPSTAQD